MALPLYLFWCVTTAVWVWLAVSPATTDLPEWVLRTREVCFGSFDNGLPDLYGWVNLAAPIPMLLALFGLMGREFKQQVEGLSRRFPKIFSLLLILGLPSATLAYLGWRVAEAPRLTVGSSGGPLPLSYPQIDEPCPAVELTDQDGQPFVIDQLKGSVALMTFAYAHCQTVCPALMDNVVGAARTLGCPVVVVTLDPRRDTCGSLGGLAQLWRLPARSLVLGGEVEPVENALKAFSMPIERNPKTGEIAHPALVLVVDSHGHLRYRFNNPSQDWLQEAVTRLRTSNDSP